MKRPKILEENNDLLEQVNYIIEMDKYCDYLEEQKKQLSIHGVVSSFLKKESEVLGLEVNDLYLHLFNNELYLETEDKDSYYFNLIDVRKIDM